MVLTYLSSLLHHEIGVSQSPPSLCGEKALPFMLCYSRLAQALSGSYSRLSVASKNWNTVLLWVTLLDRFHITLGKWYPVTAAAWPKLLCAGYGKTALNPGMSPQKATRKTDKPPADEVDVADLTDESLKDQLLKYGVSIGPIVGESRTLALYI